MLEDSTVTCITDSVPVGTETVIDEIIPIIECEYIEVLDSTLCFEVGADTTYMDIDVYDFSEECSTMYHYAEDVLYDVPGTVASKTASQHSSRLVCLVPTVCGSPVRRTTNAQLAKV